MPNNHKKLIILTVNFVYEKWPNEKKINLEIIRIELGH